MALICADNISLGYDAHAIVEGLSFEVKTGDYLCIVGENGSGKTTLMKTLLGLTKPLKGRIEFGDGLKPREIGYLPQQTAVQKDFPASVREVVLSGFEGSRGLRFFSTREEKRKAGANMERMGVLHLASKCYRELSGGQQQRVLAARALCAAEKLLLLDEPLNGLDPHAASEMYGLIKGLHEEGMSIIMISHDLTEAFRGVDKILHIGREIFFGSREDYMKSGFTMLCERTGEGEKRA